MSIRTIWSMKAASLNFARQNRYEIEIIPPSGINLGDHKDMRKINFNCNAAEIPGRILAVAESRTAGPIRSQPYDRIYNPVTMGFYADENLAEWYFFNDWMDKISEKSKNRYSQDLSVVINEDVGIGETPKKTRNFEYYNDFIGQVTIGQLDMISSQTKMVKLVEAYPVNISPIMYGYDNSDAIQTFNVTFQFREYTVDTRSVAADILSSFVPAGAISEGILDAIRSVG